VNFLEKITQAEIITIGEPSTQILPDFEGCIEIGNTLRDLRRNGFGDPTYHHFVAPNPSKAKRIGEFWFREGTVNET
jgi:hypothetical protein